MNSGENTPENKMQFLTVKNGCTGVGYMLKLLIHFILFCSKLYTSNAKIRNYRHFCETEEKKQNAEII